MDNIIHVPIRKLSFSKYHVNARLNQIMQYGTIKFVDVTFDLKLQMNKVATMLNSTCDITTTY